MNLERPILYLTIEIALDTSLPTYSGGLGVLAGARGAVRSGAVAAAAAPPPLALGHVLYDELDGPAQG